jgi:NAD dependent epimerase/dehydratase family enzyme
MQTILGPGGPIGTEVAKALANYTDQIRLVSRHPEQVNADDQLHPVDLLQAQEVEKAVAVNLNNILILGRRRIWKGFERS